MNIYIGNLPFSLTDSDVRSAFEAYGSVSSVTLVTDRETGRPRGFGFVEMDVDSEARAAIEGLNGKEIGGRSITVNEARPRTGGGPRKGGREGGGGGRDRRW